MTHPFNPNPIWAGKKSTFPFMEQMTDPSPVDFLWRNVHSMCHLAPMELARGYQAQAKAVLERLSDAHGANITWLEYLTSKKNREGGQHKLLLQKRWPNASQNQHSVSSLIQKLGPQKTKTRAAKTRIITPQKKHTHTHTLPVSSLRLSKNTRKRAPPGPRNRNRSRAPFSIAISQSSLRICWPQSQSMALISDDARRRSLARARRMGFGPSARCPPFFFRTFWSLLGVVLAVRQQLKPKTVVLGRPSNVGEPFNL